MTKLAGLGRYILSLFRSHKWVLTVWVAVLAVLTVATAASIADYYTGPAERASYARALEIASIMEAIGGASGGFDQLGGIIANEVAIIFITALAVAGIMLAVGRTRKEEDQGRTELVTSKPVGWLAPLGAGVVTVTASLLLNAVVTMVIFVAYGVPLVGAEAGTNGPADGGALAYGLLVFAYSMFFAGVGFVVAEIADNSRTATTIGIGVFVALYMVRVWVNGSAPDLWWLTPIGWFDRVAPFAEMRWGPMVALFVAALVFNAVAAVMRMRRDVGAGLVGARGGRAHAPAWLGTPAGLMWRLVRTQFFGWIAVGIAFGVLFGSQIEEWLGVLEESNNLTRQWGFTADADSVTQMLVLVCAVVAGAVGITQMSAVHKEEKASRTAFLLAKPISRVSYIRSAIAIAATSAVVTQLVAGLAYAGSARLAESTFDFSGAMGAMAINSVPVVLITAAAAFSVGALGQGTWLGWVVYGAAIVISFLGSMLQLPDWAFNLSVFDAIGKVPVDPINWVGVAIEAVLAVALIVGAIAGFKRREISEG